MIYNKLYTSLQEISTYEDDTIRIDENTEIRNYNFNSLFYNILSSNEIYHCKSHNLSFNSDDSRNPKVERINKNIDISDIDIPENRNFRYQVFKPSTPEKFKDVVIFSHGFNEKYWKKYLPWAKKIANETGKLVVLFPIAFHMNRAPL